MRGEDRMGIGKRVDLSRGDENPAQQRDLPIRPVQMPRQGTIEDFQNRDVRILRTILKQVLSK